MKRHSWGIVSCAALLAANLLPCGCTQSGAGWKPLFAQEGEEWTILCTTVQGSQRSEQARRIADALRRTQGIDPQLVSIEDRPGESRIYYGRYLRVAERRDGSLEIPRKMRADMNLIKDLGDPLSGRFFTEARAVPVPTPDPGNPEWSLACNPETFTLRVGLFFNESGFYDRKNAAALYCQELRDKGYEAWYRHGEKTSEVCVGSFGEDAEVVVRKQGVLVSMPSAEVQALQARENFRVELWNMKSRTTVEGGQKLVRASQLVRIRDAAEAEF